jgi:hypothetical protein
MRLSYLLIIADLALTGCVSGQMNHGLGFMVGKNIGHAVNRLGYPDVTREIRGETIYVWSSSHDVNLPRKTDSTMAGNLGHVPIYTTPAGAIARSSSPPTNTEKLSTGCGPGTWNGAGNWPAGCAKAAVPRASDRPVPMPSAAGLPLCF